MSKEIIFIPDYNKYPPNNFVTKELTQFIQDDFDKFYNDLISFLKSLPEMFELNTLTYVTQESFKELNSSITNELKNIDSSIKFNNLLTSIQIYQTYQINKNTKSLRK